MRKYLLGLIVISICCFTLLGCTKSLNKATRSDAINSEENNYYQFCEKRLAVQKKYNIKTNTVANDIDVLQSEILKKHRLSPYTLEELSLAVNLVEEEYPILDEDSYIEYYKNQNADEKLLTGKINKLKKEAKLEKRYIFLQRLIAVTKSPKIKLQGDIDYNGRKIYEEELLYFMQYESLGLLVLLKGSIDIAKEKTISFFGNNGTGNKADAFRHAFISILIAKKCTILKDENDNYLTKVQCLKISEDIMTAHEDGGKRTGDNEEHDTEMDFHNNEVGREIFDDVAEQIYMFDEDLNKIPYMVNVNKNDNEYAEKVYDEYAKKAMYFDKSAPDSISDSEFDGKLVQYIENTEDLDPPDNLTIISSTPKKASYRAKVSITAGGRFTVQNGENITFSAGEKIDINSNFDVKSGAIFDAVIE